MMHTIDIRIKSTDQGFYLQMWDADGVEHEIAIGETAHRARAVAQEIMISVGLATLNEKEQQDRQFPVWQTGPKWER